MIAGIIEAFFSPSPLPAAIKFVFAATMFIGLMGFLFLTGHEQQGQ